VSDNGRGSADIDGGSGLIGVKDRVEAPGGRVWERSASDVGDPGRASTEPTHYFTMTVPFMNGCIEQ
jgi:hypothetical protein